MLQHRHRFHGHGSLRYVYRNGQGVRTKYLGIKFTRNPGRVHARVAVIVAKKVVKAAPKRNRIRRRVYEAVRLTLGLLDEGNDIAITAYSPELLLVSHDELMRELAYIKKRIMIGRQVNDT